MGKGIYKNPTMNIILNGERLCFLPKFRNNARTSHVGSHHFYSNVYWTLGAVIIRVGGSKHRRDKRHFELERKSKTVFVYRLHNYLYRKSTLKKLMNEFSNVVGYQMLYKNQLYFYMLVMNNQVGIKTIRTSKP